jgi:nitroreductase
MQYSQPITDIIRQRYSCRTYVPVPIEEAKRQQLERFMSSTQSGPFGTPVRFQLLAATEEDRTALRGLGTYGFIQGATGFIIGLVQDGAKNLEDFGYCMEQVVLFATDLGLGTCWLGGTFNRSTFAARAGLRIGEQMPAVAAVGHIGSRRGLMSRIIRRGAGSDRRYPWANLFFRERLGQPIPAEEAGPYAPVLEMVRLAPSASNKQPWRIVQDGSAWHFYLQRTGGYRRTARFGGVPDLQRADMGIAMCHWELSAQETGLPGHWLIQEPAIAKPDDLTEYTATWLAE